jgi:PKD domain
MLLLMTCAVLLAIPAMALADTVTNNVDGTVDTSLETMNLTAGGANGSAKVYVEPTGNTSNPADGKSGCNLTNNSSLTVNAASSNSAVATVSPSSATLTDCGVANGKTITVTPEGQGTATISVSGPSSITVTNGSGTEIRTFDYMANFTVNVAAAPVTNHAPTVSNAAQDANGVEGGTLTTSGAFSDQDGDTLSITKQSGAGTVEPSTTDPGQWSWSLPTTDNGSGTVVVKAEDGKGGTVTDSFDWTATNANPVVDTPLNITDPNNGTACLGGNTVNLGFSFTDAGSADTHKATIAWGDGSTDTVVDPATSPVSGKQHTYKGLGPYTITVTVEDDDAGSATGTKIQSFHYNVGNTLLSPVNADSSSLFKLGSTIPLKVNITDCNGVGVAGLSPQIRMIQTGSTTPLTGVDEGISTQPNDTNWVMRGDGYGQYIYNLASKSLPDSSATYKAQITDHGHTVTTQNYFGLKAK